MSKNIFKSKKQISIFTRLELLIQRNGLFAEGVPVRYMLPIFYVFILVLLHVWNTHHHEKLLRKAAQLESEVAEIKVDYTAVMADYMAESKQSTIAKRVEPMGLKENLMPPFKIRNKENGC